MKLPFQGRARFEAVIHGVRVGVSAPSWFVRDVLEPYFTAFSASTGPRVVDATLDVTVLESTLRSRPPQVELPAGGRTIGRDMLVGEGWAGWRAPGSETLLTVRTPTDWSVTGALRLRVDQAARALVNPGYRLGFAQLALRELVHFPLFELLARTRGVRIWHGAAVAHEGRAYLFCGLNGVGKSKLAVDAAQGLGASVITDNFVLLAGNRCLPFPEVLRLPPDVPSPPGYTPASEDPRRLVLNKRWHVARTLDVRQRLPVEAAYYLVRGSGPRVEEISTAAFLGLMNGMHQSLGEFPEHSLWGTSLENLFGDGLSSLRLEREEPAFYTALLDIGHHVPFDRVRGLLDL